MCLRPHDSSRENFNSKLAQSMGFVTSLAIAGLIFQNQAIVQVAATLPNIDLESVRSATTGTNSEFLKILPSTERLAILRGIVKTLGSVYVVIIVVCAIVVLIACFLSVSNVTVSPQSTFTLVTKDEAFQEMRR